MDPLEVDSCWDFLDNILNDTASSDLLWLNNDINQRSSSGDGINIDFTHTGGVSSREQSCSRKRAQSESFGKQGNKACREKLRREKLNCSFMELSSVLEPKRPAKTDKPAILDDAIRVVNQLKNEAQELKEENEKLLEEIKCLKAEKNELREEKLMLKVDKDRMEQQLKAITASPASYMPAYRPGVSKMPVFPGYGLVPMWQYLPQATCDTSRDHELRPPAA